MARVLELTDPSSREDAIAQAVASVRRGGVVVLPDESMYVLVCDAFSDIAVSQIRRIKGRSSVPLSVLVGRPGTVDGIAAQVRADARDLMAAFWPGSLTLLLRQQPSLAWPLTGPSVAVRMPLHPTALAVVREVGPCATSAAHLAGLSPVTDVADALGQLQGDVDLIVTGDMVPGERSTIVDATDSPPALVREGAVGFDRLAAVCPAVRDVRP